MEYKDRLALSKVRLEKAKACLAASAFSMQNGFFDMAANRSYYAIFHAMRAVLAMDEVDRVKHAGVISEFRRRYVKTGVFSHEISNIIEKQFVLRTQSDYQDFFIITREETEAQYHGAEKLVAAVEAYLSGVYAAEQAK